MKNIETLDVRAVAAASINMASVAPSVTTLVHNNPANSLTLTNVETGLTTVSLNSISADDADLDLTYAAGLTSGTADSLTLNLSGASASDTSTAANFAAVDVSGAAGNDGFDVVTINSSGSANRLDSLVVDDGTNSTLDSLTITGDQNLRINSALDFSGTTGVINAAAATGNMNLVVGTEDITATFGAGDDRLAMGSTGDLDGNDTIDMGEGTDTFAWAETATSAALNTTLAAQVSNFEKLEFTGATTAIDMDLLGGVNTVVQSGAAAGGLTISDLQNDDSIEVSGNNAGTVTFTAKLDDSANVLNLALDTVTAGGNLDATNFETVNLAITGAAASTNNGNTFTVSTNGVINVTGAQDMDLGTLVGTNSSVNATEFTGGLTVVGEAGNNTITGGAGNDDLEGGAGQDTIILTAGGTDNVVLDITATANRDAITGFTAGAGGDTIDLDNNGADNVAAAVVEAFTGAQASVTLDTAADNLHVFNFEAANNGADLTAATDGTELFKAIATEGTSIAELTVVASATGHIVAYDGGDAYLYYFAEANAASTLQASEVVLIGVLSDVAVGALTDANFV